VRSARSAVCCAQCFQWAVGCVRLLPLPLTHTVLWHRDVHLRSHSSALCTHCSFTRTAAFFAIQSYMEFHSTLITVIILWHFKMSQFCSGKLCKLFYLVSRILFVFLFLRNFNFSLFTFFSLFHWIIFTWKYLSTARFHRISLHSIWLYINLAPCFI